MTGTGLNLQSHDNHTMSQKAWEENELISGQMSMLTDDSMVAYDFLGYEMCQVHFQKLHMIQPSQQKY